MENAQSSPEAAWVAQEEVNSLRPGPAGCIGVVESCLKSSFQIGDFLGSFIVSHHRFGCSRRNPSRMGRWARAAGALVGPRC